MITTFGVTDMQVGLVNDIPFVIASVAMVLWGRHSDRTGERVWHTALPVGLSAVVLGCASLAGSSVALFVLILSLTLVGTYAMKGPLWGLAMERIPAREAAAGVAMINAVGSLAPFLGNFLIGALKDATGSFTVAVFPLVFLSALGSAVLLFSDHQPSIRAGSLTSPR